MSTTGGSLDRIPDHKDLGDQSSSLQGEAIGPMSNPGSGDSALINQYFARLANNTANPHSLELVSRSRTSQPSDRANHPTGIDNPSRNNSNSGHGLDRLTQRLEEKFDKARNGYGDLNPVTNDGSELLDNPKLKDNPQLKEQVAKEIREQMALELRMRLDLIKAGRDPIAAATQELRRIAGNDLYDGFEDDLADAIEHNHLQAIAQREADKHNLTDKHGNKLDFAFMTDEQIADGLEAAVEAYKKGPCERLDRDNFIEAFNEGLQMFCDPVGGDFQASIGSCVYNTETLAGWKAFGDRMLRNHFTIMTEGELDGIRLSTRQLNSPANGQDFVNYYPDAWFAKYLHGDNVEIGYTWNGGAPLDWGDDASVAYIGDSVSTIPGVFHHLEPGHSQLKGYVAHRNGDITLELWNHWAPRNAPYRELNEGTLAELGHIDVNPDELKSLDA